MEKLKQTIEKVKSSSSKKVDMLSEVLEIFNDLVETIKEAEQRKQQEQKTAEQPQANFKGRLIAIAPVKKVLKKAHILNLEESICKDLKRDLEKYKRDNLKDPLCVGFIETEKDGVGLIASGPRVVVIAKYGEPKMYFKEFLRTFKPRKKEESDLDLNKDKPHTTNSTDKDVEYLTGCCNDYINNIDKIEYLPLNFIEKVYSSGDVKKEIKYKIGTILFLNLLYEGDVKVQFNEIDYTTKQTTTLLANNIDLKDMSVVSKCSKDVIYFKNDILTAIGKREQVLKALSVLIYTSNGFTSTREMFEMLKEFKNTMFTQMLKLAKMPRGSVVSVTEDNNKENSLSIVLITSKK
jgi:hypothetical protein